MLDSRLDPFAEDFSVHVHILRRGDCRHPFLPAFILTDAMAPISLDEEARLYTTNAEREKYGLLATLFGIVVALDYLERAYVRDSIPAVECVPLLLVYVDVIAEDA